MKIKSTDIIITILLAYTCIMTIAYTLSEKEIRKLQTEIHKAKERELQIAIDNQRQAEKLTEEVIVLKERMHMRDSLLLESKKQWDHERITLLTNANDSVLRHIILNYGTERFNTNLLHE